MNKKYENLYNMKKKYEIYERYINHIVNDIEAPYFINMRDNYGLSEKEYSLVLSKVFNQPVTIKDSKVYETLKGINVYDDQGNQIYRENRNGFWAKWYYDNQGNKNYYENSDGGWCKREYDINGKRNYYEDSTGVIVDNR